ncbi:Predicted RNA binding protein YcfA, dsRBD-like fold, HicA-like mRNA interferase family [Thermus arciformis]|uniref:Predicted RNA binding protein YcfA, dsRBD-like fold, HicA-like mRNA interferase family n=1 Tax=Thermus arciformis TaxID=482827 RepID=A0A1G7GQA6_9DEIN|nr:type II toxin-antitoxin system HicA family toxin [Thermus arciformis]SDE90317.1 Predicted RNA binding protein YcfA, dsRBD-like fold, HicA-like mRNA interferase family [Thermus arciformis]
MKIPSLSYKRVVRALEKAGFQVVRQRGSHIRMEKEVEGKRIIVIVPAHIPIKRSTLAHILKDAQLPLEDFLDLI